MKSFLKRYDILFVILLFMLSIPLAYYEVLAFFEERTVAFRHAVRKTYGNLGSEYFPRDKIFLLMIDENFYGNYGGFPLKRSDLAEIITNLNKLGAKVVACDLLLQFPSVYGEDDFFAKALRDAGNVVLASQVFYDPERQNIKIHNPALLLKEASEVGYIHGVPTSTINSSLSRLRFYPEIASSEGGLPMAVKVVSIYMNAHVHLTDSSLTVGDMEPIPLNRLNSMYIDFSPVPGPYQSIREFAGDSAIQYISIDEKDHLSIQALKANVEGKIVIIGDTSEMSRNWYNTPAGRMYSCEIMADTMVTLLKGAPLKSTSLWVETLVNFAVLFAIVVCSAFIQDIKWRNLLIFVLFAIYIYFVTSFYVYSGLVISMSYTLLSGVLGYFGISLYDYVQERKFRREIAAKLHEKQRSLEIAEATYRSIYENAAEGIFQATPNGELINANPSMAKIMGYQSAIDIIKSVTDVASQFFMDARRGGEFIQKIRKEGKVTGIEQKFRQKNGEVFTGLISGRAVKDDYDNILYYEGSVQDMTERIQKEAAERDRKAAEAANAAKSEFLSRMSHEIRNPLNAIVLTIQSELNSVLTAKQRDTFKTIQSASENLIKILNEILDLSKIEVGKIELETTDFNLYDAMNSVADLYRDTAVAHKTELILDIGPQVPALLSGDPYRLQQIVGNLVSNAAKFTKDGDILIGVNCLKKEKSLATIEFSVEDTGLGMTGEQIKNLFSPFTQAKNSIARKYGGTGLGLSICKRLVELMGGQINVASEVGKGSRFCFALEFSRQDSNLKEKPELPGDLNRLRILVVDDKKSCREMFKKTLRALTCEPVCVESAKRAYEELFQKEKPYDLLMIDHEMPQYDGLTGLKRIRKNPKFSQLPIIFMTAFGNEETMQLAWNAGANVCIVKPVKSHQLFETILQALSKQQADTGYDHEDCYIGFAQVEYIRGATILLVEDNPINQKLTAEILNNAGIKVITADTGKEALKAVFQNRFDAVLMDIHMPEMDGYKATELIRKNSKFKDLPIIAMTASAMKKDREKCYNSGMNDYISKPIDVIKLFSVLCRWIAPKRTGEIIDSGIENNLFKNTNSNGGIRLPGINMDKAVRIMGSNEKLYLELLSRFSKKYAEIPGQIRQALWTGDFKKAQELIHGIKGVVGFLMADHLFSIIEKLELAVFNEDIDSARNLQEDLENTFKEVLTSATILEEKYDQQKHADDEKRLLELRKAGSTAMEASLTVLDGLLKEHNLDASDYLDSIMHNVTDPTLLASFKQLSEQIAQLDFKRARQHLSMIGKSFGIIPDQQQTRS